MKQAMFGNDDPFDVFHSLGGYWFISQDQQPFQCSL